MTATGTIKHADVINRIVLATRSQVDEYRHAEFDEVVRTRFAAEMDEAIDIGIRNGYSVEYQEKLVMNMITGLYGGGA